MAREALLVMDVQIGGSGGSAIPARCTDADPQVHQVLLDKVFPRQATVLSAAEWISRRGAADCA